MIIFLNHRESEKIMAAIQDLTAALAAQTTSVNALTAAVLVAIPEINPVPGSGATEAQVAAAAAAVLANSAIVDAQTKAIVTATTPPAVVPPPVTPPAGG
jgi:hypothetical protein